MWLSGFNRASEGVIDGLTADAADGGIFHFSEGKKKRIEKVNFQGENTLKGKQLHCIGYMIELAHDLALSPRDNASSSPGFETCLGIFGLEIRSLLDVEGPFSTNIHAFTL